MMVSRFSTILLLCADGTASMPWHGMSASWPIHLPYRHDGRECRVPLIAMMADNNFVLSVADDARLQHEI